MSGVETQVQLLMSMGFGEADCIRALQLNNNKLEAAVNWIIHQGSSASLIKANLNQTQSQSYQHQPSMQRTAAREHSSAVSSKVFNVKSAGANKSAKLPRGFARGRVSKFFEKNREGQPGYGFIEPLDSKFAGDLYFKWAHVVSNRLPLMEVSSRIQSRKTLDFAIDHPEEPFVVPGDIVAYRTSIQKHYVDKNKPHAAPRNQEMAVDVFVLEFVRNARFRRSQVEVSRENATPQSTNGNLSVSAISPTSASSSSSSSFTAVPSTPIAELMNKRVRGMIQQINFEDLNDQIATKPHGIIVLHHVKHTSISFFFDQFPDHDAAESSSASSTSKSVNLIRPNVTVHIGDVVEFTLTYDKKTGAFAANSIVVIPTLMYAQIKEDVKRGRKQLDSLLHSDHMIALASTVPLVYIQGSHIKRDENRHLEFKNLTRNASSSSMQANLARSADKYMNSFLNSSGGVILFGVENDGSVAGLEVNMKDRDGIRLAVEGCMNESVPPVSPKLYSFRFVRVYRLYKSSWLKNGSVWRDGSFGVTELTKMMLQPEPTDRLEQLDLYVIAIITGAADVSVPFYQTSGKGHQSKDSFIRREGSTIRMTPVDIAQHTEARNQQAADDQSKQVDDLLRSIQQQVDLKNNQAVGSGARSQNFIDDILKHVEARLIGPSSSSVASAPASLHSSPAASPISPGKSQQTSASACSLFVNPFAPIVSPSPSVSSVDSNSNLEVPAELLGSLQSMGYSTGDLLNAMCELHSRQDVNFKVVFKQGSTDAENADAVNKILNFIDSGSNAHANAPGKSFLEGRAGEQHSPQYHEHGEGQPVAASAIARFERRSEAEADLIPCEICNQGIPFTGFHEHQQSCRLSSRRI